ncbi:hypothetical protein HPB47_023164 [Ixodes persulcatus]|uniref:Uncharacterized protein n=1 Tax=Ixodes persulcatus TaxID=34615 RepID=A0AC60Q7P3_IXOPE|nr:hypothetical protein HPB47_023164 [Ixodes persulcatus]
MGTPATSGPTSWRARLHNTAPARDPTWLTPFQRPRGALERRQRRRQGLLPTIISLANLTHEGTHSPSLTLILTGSGPLEAPEPASSPEEEATTSLARLADIQDESAFPFGARRRLPARIRPAGKQQPFPVLFGTQF